MQRWQMLVFEYCLLPFFFGIEEGENVWVWEEGERGKVEMWMCGAWEMGG